MTSPSCSLRLFVLFLSLCLTGITSGAVQSKSKSKSNTPAPKSTVVAKSTGSRSRTVAKASKTTRVVSKRSRSKRRFVAGGPWLEPTYADSTLGDNVDGEDLAVRRAAVEALGPYNGTVVVADPQTGRLLTVVNQKLAFRNG